MPQLQLNTLRQPACHFSCSSLEVSALEAILKLHLGSGVGDGHRCGSEGGESERGVGLVPERELCGELVFFEGADVYRKA